MLYFKSDFGEMPLINNSYFTVTNIDGVTRTNSNISSVVIPYVDGDTITNVQAQPREVTIYLRLKQSAGIEAAKRYIFDVVKPKAKGSLRLTNDKDITLNGIVESIDLPRFYQGCTMEITLYCSQPFWEDTEYQEAAIARVIGLHHFPIAFISDGEPLGVYDDDTTQAINNTGDVSTGMQINIICTGEVINPKIVNAQTGEFIGVIGVFNENDEIIITTFKGNKTISKNGSNVLNTIMQGSTFLQLAVGANELHIEALSGIDNVYFNISYKRLYV